MPKVLVGAPVADAYEYCLEEFLKGINAIDYTNYDILLVDNSKTDDYYKKLLSLNLNAHRIDYKESARDRMVASRNVLRKYALDNGYDYLLSLDADIVLNKDTLTKLLTHKKDIISAIYFRELTNKQGQTKIFPLVLESDEENHSKIRPIEIIPKRLAKIAMCGLGRVLISRNVLKHVEFRYDKGFDDEAFCIDASAKGFDIHADTSIICRHLFLKRPWQWKDYNISTN